MMNLAIKSLLFILTGLAFHISMKAQVILPAGAARIEPEELAAILESPEADNYLILNTGPVNDIKNAVNIGAVEEKANVRKLKKFLKKIPKDKPIVYYCGCCPFATCPNLLPAAKLLEEMKFTDFRALSLPKSLKIDWIGKGYPMKEAKAEQTDN